MASGVFKFGTGSEPPWMQTAAARDEVEAWAHATPIVGAVKMKREQSPGLTREEQRKKTNTLSTPLTKRELRP